MYGRDSYIIHVAEVGPHLWLRVSACAAPLLKVCHHAQLRHNYLYEQTKKSRASQPLT
jgi:hypothetical protein